MESNEYETNNEKMWLYYILILCGLMLLSGCGISNRQEQDSDGIDSVIMELDEGEEKADVNEPCTEGSENGSVSMQYTEEDENDPASMQYTRDEEGLIENPYFYNKDHVSLQTHAEYHNGSALIDETADAEINIVKTYKEGCIYKLTVYITPFMSSWYFPSGSNMSIYLYVTSDKIYRVLPYAQPEPGGQSVNFYDDDILLTETLDTEEKLRSIGVLELVCQEEEVQEDYFSITREANRIRYDRSEIKPNGEPGDKTLFVWEEGKGLVEFGTGFGPGPMEVHIDEVREIVAQNDAYKAKELQGILRKKEKDSIDHKWQKCDLPPEKWPDYYFFTNAQQRHYNFSLENEAAFAVKDYVVDAGMEEEQWELKQIYHWRDDIYRAYTESDMGSELYIFLKTDTPDAFPYYIIAADVRKGDAADIALQEDYSYHSMLEWHSCQEWFGGGKCEVQVDTTDEIYDAIYYHGVFAAIYDYVNMTDGEGKSRWEVNGNDTYIGRNGYIVCATCNDGAQDIVFLVDIWNKMYAVLEFVENT